MKIWLIGCLVTLCCNKYLFKKNIMVYLVDTYDVFVHTSGRSIYYLLFITVYMLYLIHGQDLT